jgi:ABC-type phosphate/phosphonate transport system substrate-binding protein
MKIQASWYMAPIITALSLLGAGTASAAETLTMGVLAYLPKSEILERYQPIADRLSKSLGDINIKLVPLSYDNNEIENALNRKELDLVLTNPSHYIKLKKTYKFIGPLVTQEVFEKGQPTAMMGGVIFTRADRADIKGLPDIVGVQIASPDIRSLGGYQAQVYELLKAGLPVPQKIAFKQKHDLVAMDVINSKADVGFVRTGVLESMEKKGLLKLSSIKIINPQTGAGFPVAVSTRLYPEWPIVATQQVSQEKIRRVTNALLSIKISASGTSNAGIAGYVAPKSYLQIEEVERELKIQ